MVPGMLTGVSRTPLNRTLASSTVGAGGAKQHARREAPAQMELGALVGAHRGRPHETQRYEADGIPRERNSRQRIA